jgi:hypothetical protein
MKQKYKWIVCNNRDCAYCGAEASVVNGVCLACATPED